MARKTIEVETLQKKTNDMLRESHGVCKRYRESLCTLLESVLHDTGNYYGFRYLDQFQVRSDELPGIRCGDKGAQLPDDERFVNTDDTRREYL